MAVSPLEANFTLFDLRNSVMQQDILLPDALQSISALPDLRNVVSGHRTWIQGGFVSPAPGKAASSWRLEALAACPGGTITVEQTIQKEGEESLWQGFFLDPTQWRDVRLEKKHAHHPDFRHKRSAEALWLDSQKKPAWVDFKLAMWDCDLLGWKGIKEFPEVPPSISTSGGDVSLRRGAMYEKNSDAKNWNGFCEEGELTEVVTALDLLLQRGSRVDSSLFYSVLRRCIAQKDLALGRRIHALSVKGGYSSDAFLANHIIRMYVSHGRLVEATQVFTEVPAPNIHMWASIIMAHAELGLPKLAIKLYLAMCKSGVKPNSYIFVASLKACAKAEDLASGREVHAEILGRGCEHDIFVANCLVDMYAKCGTLEDARKVFDSLQTKDLVTWNAMIAGYVQHGFGHEALAVYARMQQECCTPANHFTFSSVLKACGRARALQEGKKIHSEIQQKGLEAHVVVGNSLVDMYAKCGMLEDARRVFNDLHTKDVMTWTTMIAEYVQQEKTKEAFTLYAKMEEEGMVVANKVTFVCLLKACTSAGALHHGQRLHAQILERGLETDLVIGNCLVHMYAKCGRLSEACRVFDRLPISDVVTWNSLLKGYAEHSDARRAIRCFEEMRQQSVEPNDVTFCCLLVACSHEGLVKEGHRYFKRMVEDHGIAPNAHHVACMVDLLGRSNRLEEAEHMLRTMPFETDIVGWITLLNACKIHGDIERGRRCFERLITLEPEDARAYVLLASMYASVGRWSDVDRVEGLRQSAGAKKKPAKACIEVNKELHEFIVGEERGDISSKMRNVSKRLKEDGSHVPYTQLVLKAVTDGEKEDALCGHAEKLALAYGLLNTPDGTTLLVTKNLRMCNDCHNGTKIMSRLEKREIVVRDAHRVHHFVDGSCSCRDRH